MKTVLVFQGGGPLGAFGCGAWEAIAPWLRDNGHEVVALGGSSIGAFNAAVLRPRLHTSGGGAGHLSALWRNAIAMPSLPFLGMPVGDSPLATELRSWNGLLTSMLAGNGLFRPNPVAWGPWAFLRRDQLPLYDRGRMWQLLQAEVPSYRSADASDVLLFAATTDVDEGRLLLHDSDQTELGPAQVAASSAMPMMFDAVALEGRPQWDGDLVRESPVQPVLEAVRRSGRARTNEPLLLITIEQLAPPSPRPPRSGIELVYRALTLSQVGKLAPRETSHVRWLRIARPTRAFDGISGLMDHSPERIDTLIAQGRTAVAQALVAQAPPPENRPRPRRRTTTV